MPDTLPEGTDHIVPGAAKTSDAEFTDSTVTPAADSGAAAASKDAAVHATSSLKPADLRDKAQAKAAELRDQAGDRARELAQQGKDRATGALHDVARLIDDNASQLDDKVGSQFGDYARQAADAVTGVAERLDAKDVDEVFEDLRGLVRQSPGAAIGIAAAVGFAFARVLKAGGTPGRG